jgi:septal ring factor EnvC (AmiA/AmiB activator)
MTKRTSGSNEQTERALTKAELQRIEERRHVESVIRNARRVRLPKKRAMFVKHDDPVKAARIVPAQEQRPLTPAEQERIDERRRVESVMRNARRSRLRLRKKPAAVRSGGGGAAAGSVEAPAGSSARRSAIRSLRTVLGVVALALGCALLGLTLKTVFQHDRLAENLASLREETSLLKGNQQESLDKIEQALIQFAAAEDKVEARLQAVIDSQGKLESKVGVLEAGQAVEAARWQEDLSSLEEATREGLAGVAARLDSEESLAASLEKLLPLLQPSDSIAPVQTSSETTPAS